MELEKALCAAKRDVERAESARSEAELKKAKEVEALQVRTFYVRAILRGTVSERQEAEVQSARSSRGTAAEKKTPTILAFAT